jgi:hypothetical protein
MNNTVINIEGIKVNHSIIKLEHSTDVAHLLVIKDEHNNEVLIYINNGKITHSKTKK